MIARPCPWCHHRRYAQYRMLRQFVSHRIWLRSALSTDLKYLRPANAVRYGTAKAEWFLNAVRPCSFRSACFLSSRLARPLCCPPARLSRPVGVHASPLPDSTQRSCSLVLKERWGSSPKVCALSRDSTDHLLTSAQSQSALRLCCRPTSLSYSSPTYAKRPKLSLRSSIPVLGSVRVHEYAYMAWPCLTSSRSQNASSYVTISS